MRLIFTALLMLALANTIHAQPTDNPVRTHYGNGNYPIWTDQIAWHNVIDMTTYTNGANWFEKFENARDQLYSQGGGVLYFPAGTYDFSDMPADDANGRGLMLRSGVVIRGQTPTAHSRALNDTLALGTKFVFPYTQKAPGKLIPKAWNYIGLMPEAGQTVKDVNNVGVVWVHTNRGAIYFGGDYTFGNTWATAGAWYSGKAAKGRWANRIPDGTHPMDPFAGASGNYLGAGKGRLVMGCALINSAVTNDDLINLARDKYDTISSFYHTYKFGARIGIYGSNVFVANNWLPKSHSCFKYQQTTAITQQDKCNQAFGNHTKTLIFDYGKTFGLDVNKGFLNPFNNTMQGFEAPNVIVRDNLVYNHGSKGYELSGGYIIVKNNINQRNYLQEGANIYGLGTGWELTLDGFYESQPGGNGCLSDNLSRAFDMAGAYGWIDSCTYGNTGSSPGNDGEGILWQAHGGMASIKAFALTNNNGGGYQAGYDVDVYGGLWAWNNTSTIGNKKAGSMYDVSFVNNNAGVQITTANSVLSLCPTSNPAPPTNVVATAHPTQGYAEITWTDNSTNEVGYRIDKSIGNANNWKTLAYRPRKDNTAPSPNNLNPTSFRDYQPARGVPTYYRVVAMNCANTNAGATTAAQPVLFNNVVSAVAHKSNHSIVPPAVFPNPATNTLNIATNQVVNSIKLYHTNGQLIYNQNPTNIRPHQINLQQLPKGLYLLQIITSNGLFTHKVLKQ